MSDIVGSAVMKFFPQVPVERAPDCLSVEEQAKYIISVFTARNGDPKSAQQEHQLPDNVQRYLRNLLALQGRARTSATFVHALIKASQTDRGVCSSTQPQIDLLQVFKDVMRSYYDWVTRGKGNPHIIGIRSL